MHCYHVVSHFMKKKKGHNRSWIFCGDLFWQHFKIIYIKCCIHFRSLHAHKVGTGNRKLKDTDVEQSLVAWCSHNFLWKSISWFMSYRCWITSSGMVFIPISTKIRKLIWKILEEHTNGHDIRIPPFLIKYGIYSKINET